MTGDHEAAPPDLRAFLREKSYVGGRWIASGDGGTIAVRNPATGAVLGHVPDGGRAEAAQAVATAKAALPFWKALTARDRAGYLHRLADLVEASVEPLAVLLTSEQGKSLREARGEVAGSAAYVRWFAEEAQRVYGDVVPSPWPDRRILVTREPVGVVGAITPWNFPSSMIARKLAPALAAGCTIVIKPSELTPFSGLAWAVLAGEAGLPPGVVNVVTGSPAEIGAELIDRFAIAETGSAQAPRGLSIRFPSRSLGNRIKA